MNRNKVVIYEDYYFDHNGEVCGDQIIECPRCKDLFLESETYKERQSWYYFLKSTAFKDTYYPSNDIPDFCMKCHKELFQFMHIMADVCKLKSEVYKLERSIQSVKRNQNNRPTESNAG